MFPLFKEIGDKYGPFDLTLISNGAYSKLWFDSHFFPEEVVQVHRKLRGEVLLPIHWATFDLADHAWYDPAERVYKAAEKADVRAIYPQIGQIIQYEKLPEPLPWWRQEMSKTE